MRLNPFRLIPDTVDAIWRQNRATHQAKVRYQRVLDTYKEMLGDPRYAAVKDDLALTLGTELDRLVTLTATCAHCRGQAERVAFLAEVVRRPLQVAWDEARQARLDEATHEL